MALHGEIKVNGEVIGNWEAVRRRGLPSASGDKHLYHCVVQMDDAANSGPHLISFQVAHNYADGALVLAAKVLAKAHDRIEDNL